MCPPHAAWRSLEEDLMLLVGFGLIPYLSGIMGELKVNLFHKYKDHIGIVLPQKG